MRLHDLKLCWISIWVHIGNIWTGNRFLSIASMKTGKRPPNRVILLLYLLSKTLTSMRGREAGAMMPIFSMGYLGTHMSNICCV